jgi:DNA-binding MarR family transcriptional regulator
MHLKQYSLLCQLRDHGGAVSQQALVEMLHLDPNIVVLLLNDVEAAGFAERRRDPSDRRRHIVEITRSGRRAVERAEKGLEGVEDEVLSALSLQERGELHRLLTRALESEAREEDGRVAALARPAAGT